MRDKIRLVSSAGTGYFIPRLKQTYYAGKMEIKI